MLLFRNAIVQYTHISCNFDNQYVQVAYDGARNEYVVTRDKRVAKRLRDLPSLQVWMEQVMPGITHTACWRGEVQR
jgi:hypothetical protein